MGEMSTYLANKVLDAVFNNQALQYANVYISLHTDDPGDDGSHEVTAGENTYTRKQTAPANWNSASSKTIDTDVALEWPDMPGVTVKYVGVWDAQAGVGTPEFLWKSSELSPNKVVPAGETFRIAAGDLEAEIDPS